MDEAVLERAVVAATGEGVRSSRALSGGCVASVRLAELASGGRVVVKLGGGTLGVEAMMLRFLGERSSLPVPGVVGLVEDPEALVLEYVEGGGSLGADGERHAAELLVSLHSVTATAEDGREGGFGFDCDTVIGPLRQPNGWRGEWWEFWRDERLMHFARGAREGGPLPGGLFDRLERLAGRLDASVCPPPGGPAGAVGRLVHGDCWGGNVLASGDGARVAAFIDPAVHFGHPESELAFATLFGTFGRAFFDRYAELSEAVGDWEGFWGVRRDLYNLVPLLVHVRLFGGGYVGQLEAALGRTGLG